MGLTMDNFTRTFEVARMNGDKFVFVGILAEGTEEIIAVPAKSFEAKEAFYKRAYSDNLVHAMNSNVRIFGWSHGDETALNDLL